MMKYEVAGIRFSFDYQFKDFFGSSIEKYAVSDDNPVNHSIIVEVVEDISPPKGDKEIVNKLSDLLMKEDWKVLIVYDESREFIRYSIENYLDFHLAHLRIKSNAHSIMAEIEYVVSGLYFLEVALSYGILAIHGAAIEYRQEGIIFSAPSGTGKSTHANLWRQYHPETLIINDDKPLVFENEGKFFVSGSPWSGKNSINLNRTVPIRAIVFLEQSSTNSIRPLTNKEKLIYLMRNIFRPSQKKEVNQALAIIEKFMFLIPIYLLQCTISEEAVQTVYDQLYQEENNHDN